MSDFLTLFKYEFKLQFPFKGKKEKRDFVGGLMSFLITALIVVVFVYLVSTIANNYVLVEINKVSDPIGRALELMNVFYAAIIVVMSLSGVEQMRKSLTERKNREIFLRLPVNPQTIFLSKISVLLIMNYVLALVLVGATNIIFYIALKPDLMYWVYTVGVWLVFPFVSLLISSILIIPYIKIIDFLKDKYAVIFILFTALLAGAFFLYSEVLGVVQRLLETGNIKFLFNMQFITTLQTILKYSYPANSLASIVLGVDFRQSLLIVAAVIVLAVTFVYLITKRLFYITLYQNEKRIFKYKKIEDYTLNLKKKSLMKKEFITIFREPKNLFSYFAISLAMPIMVYCCYTLFVSLIYNTVGFKIEFSLALLIILIFSVLTNTFCSTNISREGVAFLNMKALPVSANEVLSAKVSFCNIVSSLAVILSSILLVVLTDLSIVDGVICAALGVIFSMAQVLIATRMDLNHANLTLSNIEIEKESSKTIAKVVFIGLIVALLSGVLSIVVTILSLGSNIDFIANLNLSPALVYIIPIGICLLYILGGYIYYKVKMEKRYLDLVA